MQFKFQSKNFLYFFIILGIEICIALFVHDRFIRPFIGDMLVIWLIVYFLRSIFIVENQGILIGAVFLFACLIEITQYFQLLELLSLQGNRLLSVVIGATFDWLDILAYAVGSGLLLTALLPGKNGVKND